MIILFTGVPGAGKTLSMVHQLAKLQQEWLSKPDLVRPVFVLGILDLALEHQAVPLKSVQVTKAGSPSLIPDWEAMPDGSLVLLDEAQGVFPPRSSASQAPEHVAWLNTHRHRGFDLWITTQHPKLIDGTVRALVGKHLHFRRMFGGNRAVCYEWDACSDSLSGFKNAVKSVFNYPKSSYKYYKSAEIHTKQKFRYPIWFLLPVISLVMGVIFIPNAWSTISNGISGKGLQADQQESIPTVPASIPVNSLNAVMPNSNTVAKVVAPNPDSLISACISSANRCQCYTHNGVHVDMSDEECRSAAIAPNERFRLNVPDRQQSAPTGDLKLSGVPS